MPRFYFDIHDGARESLDEEGTQLADLQAACDEVIAVLPAIAGNERAGSGNRELVATVRGESGAAVFRARLSLTSEWLDGSDGAEPPKA
jgi:hypothetical protein